MTLFYLASPYSHEDADVRERRYHRACIATAELIHAGNHVFSPIAHSHILARDYIASDADTDWLALDFEILKNADVLAVLKIAGWEESEGVQAEIKEARRLRLPILFLGEDTK